MVTPADGEVKRQRRSIAEKRRIVEETLAPGASVALIARAHGVNANQVFGWRRLYRAGRLGGAAQVQPDSIKLLPVTVEAPRTLAASTSAESRSANSPTGAIHIKLNHAQIRIEGQADADLLRMILESLRG